MIHIPNEQRGRSYDLRFQQKNVVFSQIFQFFTINYGRIVQGGAPPGQNGWFLFSILSTKVTKKQSPSYPTYKPMGMYLTKLYPLVNEHSYGKWPIEIDGLPNKNGDFL